MKSLKKILIFILLVVAIFALASCDDKPQAKQLTDLTLPKLNDNQAAVIIKNGDSDYVSYTVNLTKVSEGDVTVEDVLAYLKDEAGLTLDWTDSTYGKYINAIGGLTPKASNNEYIEVFTSNSAFQGTWAGVAEIKADGVALKSASVGVSELVVASGDVIYFEIATF